ncbi:MAG: S41 family peptidase [Alphaproteobacteria bacterium]
MQYSFKIITTLLLGTVLTSQAIAMPPKITQEQTEDPYFLMELFGAAYNVIKSEYVEETDNKKLIETAIDGMLTQLDPHSGFMDAESYAEMETQTKGEFGGLGMEVGMEKGFVRIMAPIDDTPAYKAGLQTGDYITHVDGISTFGQSLNDTVKKMRGKPGTKVKLTISRKDKDPFDVTIKRAIITVNPVKFEAKDNAGYLRISTFSETTTDDLKKAITNLTQQIGRDKLTGFILDLRNNPGGLLDQAVGVSDVFLSRGEIVSTRSRNPEDTMRFSASDGDMTNGLPVVVLINEGSASASEIVAGALQDHKRAVIVGLKSFGKGSVQTVRSIPGFGGMRITTARYYTPSGNSIQAKGITPDIIIPRAKLEEEPMITGYGEADLPKAIAAEEGKKAIDARQKALKEKEEKKALEALLKKNTDKDENKSSTDEDTKTDYQLDRALDILQALSVMYRSNESTLQSQEK